MILDLTFAMSKCQQTKLIIVAQTLPQIVPPLSKTADVLLMKHKVLNYCPKIILGYNSTFKANKLVKMELITL